MAGRAGQLRAGVAAESHRLGRLEDELATGTAAELEARFVAFGRLLSRLPGGRRQWLQRPVYVLIGSAGAGKSALLQAAGGRRLIVDDSDYRQPLQTGEAPVCSWWQLEQALVVEIGGACFEAEGESLWRRLAAGLQGQGWRLACSGILLALPVEELIASPAAQRQQWTARAARAASLLAAHLRLRLPLYVLLTRMDRVPGFVAVAAADPRQACGFGLPWPPSASRDGLRRELQAGCLRLAAEARQASLIEPSPAAEAQSAGLLLYPARLQRLCEPLRELAAQLPDGDGEAHATGLRGVWLTAARSDGSRLEPLLGGGLPQAAPVADQRPAAVAQFFGELLPADSRLAGQSPAAARSDRLRLAALGLVLGLLTAGLCLRWFFLAADSARHLQLIQYSVADLQHPQADTEVRLSSLGRQSALLAAAPAVLTAFELPSPEPLLRSLQAFHAEQIGRLLLAPLREELRRRQATDSAELSTLLYPAARDRLQRQLALQVLEGRRPLGPALVPQIAPILTSPAVLPAALGLPAGISDEVLATAAREVRSLLADPVAFDRWQAQDHQVQISLSRGDQGRADRQLEVYRDYAWPDAALADLLAGWRGQMQSLPLPPDLQKLLALPPLPLAFTASGAAQLAQPDLRQRAAELTELQQILGAEIDPQLLARLSSGYASAARQAWLQLLADLRLQPPSLHDDVELAGWLQELADPQGSPLARLAEQLQRQLPPEVELPDLIQPQLFKALAPLPQQLRDYLEAVPIGRRLDAVVEWQRLLDELAEVRRTSLDGGRLAPVAVTALDAVADGLVEVLARELDQLWQRDVLRYFHQHAAGLYPFDPSATEAVDVSVFSNIWHPREGLIASILTLAEHSIGDPRVPRRRSRIHAQLEELRRLQDIVGRSFFAGSQDGLVMPLDLRFFQTPAAEDLILECGPVRSGLYDRPARRRQLLVPLEPRLQCRLWMRIGPQTWIQQTVPAGPWSLLRLLDVASCEVVDGWRHCRWQLDGQRRFGSQARRPGKRWLPDAGQPAVLPEPASPLPLRLDLQPAAGGQVLDSGWFLVNPLPRQLGAGGSHGDE